MQKFYWLWLLLQTSFRNLWRNPRRTAVSLFAIAAATAAMITFQAFVDGVKKTFRHNVIRSEFGHYQIFEKGYRTNEKDDPFAYQINNQGQIRAAIEQEIAPLSFMGSRQGFYGLLSFNDRTVGGAGIGIEPEEEQKFLTMNKVKEGSNLTGTKESSIFLGVGLARKLHIKVGDSITLLVTTVKGSFNAADLDVVGLLSSGIKEIDDGIFYVHLSLAQKLLRTTGASQIIMAFKDDDEVKFQRPLKQLLATKFPSLEAWHWRELATFFDNTMGWVIKQAFVFKVIILVIAAISIVNVFTMSLLERIGEFGTLRALGTKRREVLGMILTESLVQSMLGSFLGVMFAAIIIKIILAKGIVMPPPPLMTVEFWVFPEIPWHSIPLTLLAVIGVAGGAGIFPAVRMARINIVEALGRNI